MATKHEKIIQFIESLPVGEKISVRMIAKKLDVSEGTAYRAIKKAEKQGIVTTIKRVGTIRIDRKNDKQIDQLTYHEIIRVIDGEVLGGNEGLDKTLNRFIIGAMLEDAVVRYLTENSLMIVGNREDVQRLSLKHGAAVLITGGFKASQDIIDQANDLNLPLMSTTYDTFTVASVINKAMTDQLIKKEILLIENIYTRLEETDYLYQDYTVADYRNLNRQSNHSRFPVVNAQERLVGIVSARDVIGKADHVQIDKVMTKDLITAKLRMSVSSVGHSMIWDGLEVIPVVTDDYRLKGIISRQDVMKAMQSQQRQSQMGNTISDQIYQLVDRDEHGNFEFNVIPQMTNQLGNISFGVLSELITKTTELFVAERKTGNLVIEQIQLHYFKTIQFGRQLKIKHRIFDESRRSIRLDVEVMIESGLAAKALVTYQFINKV